jgi:CubicO group peptidase (beta-lactamase class C family)
MRAIKHIVTSFLIAIAFTSYASADPNQSLTPPPTKILSIDTWQNGLRPDGLVNLHRIMPNLLAVNAQDVYPLNYQAADYELHEIPSVTRVIFHPAISALVVINDNGDVLFEHYKNGNDRNTTFSDQSSTKSMGYILLNRALSSGEVALDDKVEKYIPYIGKGFQGRTVGDVAAMAVNHNVAELAAYTGDPKALVMFNRDERVIGLQRNDKKETARMFVQEIELAPEAESNEWKGEIANYATVNTNVLGLILESATGVPLSQQVRSLLHEVGGQNTMYMGTDFEGVPMIGASMLSSTVDFARYGRLLIKDKEAVLRDRARAKTDGQPVPPQLTFLESRYYKSAIMNDYGIGHSGWGGQLVWADADTGIIIAANSQVNSKLPAPYDHFKKLYEAAIDIVKHYRAKEGE